MYFELLLFELLNVSLISWRVAVFEFEQPEVQLRKGTFQGEVCFISKIMLCCGSLNRKNPFSLLKIFQNRHAPVFTRPELTNMSPYP